MKINQYNALITRWMPGSIRLKKSVLKQRHVTFIDWCEWRHITRPDVGDRRRITNHWRLTPPAHVRHNSALTSNSPWCAWWCTQWPLSCGRRHPRPCRASCWGRWRCSSWARPRRCSTLASGSRTLHPATGQRERTVNSRFCGQRTAYPVFVSARVQRVFS